jgi:hypothetical protein
LIPISRLTDTMQVVLAAIRKGNPFLGLTSHAISRRKHVVDRLVNAGLVKATDDGHLYVVEDRVAKLQCSWGHAIRPLSERESATVERYHGTPQRGRTDSYRTCTASRRCDHKAAFVTSYRYVTGRRGRVSCAEKMVCAEHARAFRDKHGISADAPPAVDAGEDRRQLMQAVRAATDYDDLPLQLSPDAHAQGLARLRQDPKQRDE